MSQSAPIFNALCLPITDVDALVKGQSIAAISQSFLRPGQQFGLYPDNSNLDSGNVFVNAWARCELCQIIDSAEALDIISRLTVWSVETLEEILAQREVIWLVYLRVYLLPNSVEVSAKATAQFIPLSHPITVTDDLPVIGDREFAKRRERLENLELPEDPELENLQIAISQLAFTNHAAKLLAEQIQVFLGWQETKPIQISDPNLDWIKDREIVTLGDRSKEQDEGKSNYQAGTDFENIVRKGLEFLGFKADYAHKGGAGGLDLLCLEPFPLFGECKAGKKIPNDTAVQLLNLGTLRKQELFETAAKLIIGSGEPTEQLEDAAKVHGMAIINPTTLQNLVELKAKYSGSINLIELRKYLVAGRSDEKVDEYIQKVETEIRLRSHVVQAVKELQAHPDEKPTPLAIRVQYNAKFIKDREPRLEDREIHDLLVELSSPLAGYLGRERGNDWRSDRFYFLRDLTID
ncbi:DUF1802 family protein [Pseudanabaena sp. PCC 6802]|uniref:DUF1802 family protein n=1 Tax=Pseudanabaena sp. PCC 6802 TaxID=118173 RepID=UPI00034CD7CE|nr:DUF1802 family protein [Pseudanabaena sp. PCC 6802]